MRLSVANRKKMSSKTKALWGLPATIEMIDSWLSKQQDIASREWNNNVELHRAGEWQKKKLKNASIDAIEAAEIVKFVGVRAETLMKAHKQEQIGWKRVPGATKCIDN